MGFLEGASSPESRRFLAGHDGQRDAGTLRHNPLLELDCGRLPESDPDLASQLTRSRLETPRLVTGQIRIGGHVQQLTRLVYLRPASSHPGEPLWQLLADHHGRS